MTEVRASLKERIGCWLNERWRAELVIRFPWLSKRLGFRWVDLCNRGEQLSTDVASGGRICDWRDSSRYTATRIFPSLAPRLMREALSDWRITVSRPPEVAPADSPVVSIIIPIGGADRLDQFDLALQAARSQSGVDVEVVVVEQSPEPVLSRNLPADVIYFHQPAAGDGGFNKSRALNAGARVARGDTLVILDGDYLLPQAFACESRSVLREREAARPARWIFYLDRRSSAGLYLSRDLDSVGGVEAVVSNNPTPIVVRRTTYWEIGGHDESYLGWGGEDNEFLDRLRTRNISEGGWMPVLHVWHPAAPKKADGDRNLALHAAKMSIPATERVRLLTAACREAIVA